MKKLKGIALTRTKQNEINSPNTYTPSISKTRKAIQIVITSENKETVSKGFFPEDERPTMPNITASFSPNKDNDSLDPKVFNKNEEKYHSII
jgi:hypothetical protein